ncbi:MAG: Fe-S protein assembly co-chaperone HscB [Magnetococcales bacterium]|nr:Fe-S protein assembly co-chaperone HscB [Magnetococcales bacterium]
MANPSKSERGWSCWSCQAWVGQGAFCPTCQVIQPVAPHADYFSLFALPRAFALDGALLQQPYQALQRQFHPDRFAQRGATERRLSLEQVTHLNRAYQTLADPLRRSEYLLEQAGLGAEIDEKALNRDPTFLMEVMEQREALEEVDVQQKGAMQQLQVLRDDAQGRIAHEVAVLHTLHGVQEPDWAAIARHNHRLRYHQRFVQALDQVEEQIWQQEG